MPELATSSELLLIALQQQVVASLRIADARNWYDVAAHLDAAHQLIMDRMRQTGLASSIIEVAPPLGDLP